MFTYKSIIGNKDQSKEMEIEVRTIPEETKTKTLGHQRGKELR